MRQMTKQDEELAEVLLTLTLIKVAQLIELVCQDESFNNKSGLVKGLKAWFVQRFVRELNVPVHCFKSTQKRYRTELRGDGGVVILISKMDSKDMESAYVKLYENHKDLFLELYEKHTPKPLVSEVV